MTCWVGYRGIDTSQAVTKTRCIAQIVSVDVLAIKKNETTAITATHHTINVRFILTNIEGHVVVDVPFQAQ